MTPTRFADRPANSGDLHFAAAQLRLVDWRDPGQTRLIAQLAERLARLADEMDVEAGEEHRAAVAAYAAGKAS